MQITYVESQSMAVQGKRAEIYQRYGKEWNIREQGKGHGNWLFTKPSDVLVDGKSYRSYILERYGNGSRRLQKIYVDKFIDDVKNGRIQL